ncbi:MAG: HNH endonuclease [Bacteroidetes bacterium]|nr:MAG: HNH endonuclease [Bacteroidota bacterium]TAG86230.1 MAG: HNH endonuclease [Bacteroidota bacterium]
MNLQGKKVLILNQDYRALTICSVEKAFILVYLNKAELVAEVPGLRINTITSYFAMPSIIRLFRYVNLPYKGVVLTRQNIFKRDGGKCQYCGTTHDLTLDHVLPRSRGGKSSWENLATACKPCNSRKGDRTPQEAKMSLTRQPFKPTFLMFLRDYSGMLDENWRPYLGASKITI